MFETTFEPDYVRKEKVPVSTGTMLPSQSTQTKIEYPMLPLLRKTPPRIIINRSNTMQISQKGRAIPLDSNCVTLSKLLTQFNLSWDTNTTYVPVSGDAPITPSTGTPILYEESDIVKAKIVREKQLERDLEYQNKLSDEIDPPAFILTKRIRQNRSLIVAPDEIYWDGPPGTWCNKDTRYRVNYIYPVPNYVARFLTGNYLAVIMDSSYSKKHTLILRRIWEDSGSTLPGVLSERLIRWNDPQFAYLGSAINSYPLDIEEYLNLNVGISLKNLVTSIKFAVLSEHKRITAAECKLEEGEGTLTPNTPSDLELPTSESEECKTPISTNHYTSRLIIANVRQLNSQHPDLESREPLTPKSICSNKSFESNLSVINDHYRRSVEYWFNARCSTIDPRGSTKVADLYADYKKFWCDPENVIKCPCKVINLTDRKDGMFGKVFVDCYGGDFEKKRKSDGFHYVGVTLKK